jgi:oxygen-independent coproporphyrinogen-3 oxidase
VTAQTYAGWLEALDVDRPVSLYLHVPFCRQIFWYCGCNMKLANRYEPVGDYVEMLLREVDLLAGYLPGRMKISHLHWGGGSPTALEPDDLARPISQCAKIGPDRVALFGYAHVPWMARKQRLIPEEALPGARERFEQSQVAARCLRGAGYEPVGLDHFARPHDGLAKASARGELRRNFQGYTNDLAETLLGVGATSLGRTPSGLIQNISETGAWARSVASGQLPVSKGHAFSGEDRLRAHVIEQLMCFGRVDLVAAASMFGAAPDWFCDAGPELQGLADDGIVSFDERSVIVQPAARHVVRVVASAFDAYFVHRTARHSLAV